MKNFEKFNQILIDINKNIKDLGEVFDDSESEETYNCGNCFKIGGCYYMLAECGFRSEIGLISISNGKRLNRHTAFANTSSDMLGRISSKQFIAIIEDCSVERVSNQEAFRAVLDKLI